MDKKFKSWHTPAIRDGKTTKWHWIVRYPQNLKLGKHTDIGAFSYLNAKHGIVIEDEVQLGSHCSLYSVSTIDNKRGAIVLKKGCRIGSHSIIMPGVTIGENTIVGAFAFVNKSIPANVVAVGIPARIIKRKRK